jgi:anti-anti-sigma factor
VRDNLRPAPHRPRRGQQHRRPGIIAEALCRTTPACPPPWVSADTDSETTAITLRGEIDIQVAQPLHEEVTRALNRGTHVVLDLTAVTLIDCACLGMLVRSRRQADRRDRVIAMAAPAPLVERTLRATLVHTEFPIFPDRRQATAWLRTRPTDTPCKPPPEGSAEELARHCGTPAEPGIDWNREDIGQD